MKTVRDMREGMYREFADMGRARFGASDWAREMRRYRVRPHDFAAKVLGSRWWSAQEQVGKALVESRRVVVRSGNGVGKTFLAADLALWFLYTHKPAVVITSAPTWRQVRHVLWHEIRQRVFGSRVRLPGRVLQARIELGRDSFAMGLATEGGVKFQGFHCENLLIILEEASGIPDEIWDAAEGVAVSGNNRILAIGNPLRASGRFYELFKRSSGWRKLTISGLEHPNVTGKGRTIPGGVTSGFVEEKIADWCEETTNDGRRTTNADCFRWRGGFYVPNDLFRARVLGEFPRSESAALIQLGWIEAAQVRVLPAEGLKRAAADVARFGDDWTIIGVRDGAVARVVEKLKGADVTEVAGAITRLAFEEHPTSIAVDSIGIGAGVVDILVENGIDGIEGVNVSEAARDSEHFANRRAELYWGLRTRFREGEIVIPDDPLMAEELAAIRYKINSRGQIQIEEKAEIKRRLGRSPDRADMLAMLFDSSTDTLAMWEPRRDREPSEAQLLREEMRRWSR